MGRPPASAPSAYLPVLASRMKFANLIRVTVGIILAVSCVAKARDVRVFATTIGHFELVRGAAAMRFAAVGIVGWEGVTAFGLLSGLYLDSAVVSASLLLVAFSAVAARSILRGWHADCGCLGPKVGLQMGWLSVGANVVLASGLLVQLAERSILTPLAAPQVQAPATTSTVIVLCAVLLAAVYWLVPYARSVSELVDEALGTHSTLELKA